jgi:hypothetical protein
LATLNVRHNPGSNPATNSRTHLPAAHLPSCQRKLNRHSRKETHSVLQPQRPVPTHAAHSRQKQRRQALTAKHCDGRLCCIGGSLHQHSPLLPIGNDMHKQQTGTTSISAYLSTHKDACVLADMMHTSHIFTDSLSDCDHVRRHIGSVPERLSPGRGQLSQNSQLEA